VVRISQHHTVLLLGGLPDPNPKSHHCLWFPLYQPREPDDGTQYADFRMDFAAFRVDSYGRPSLDSMRELIRDWFPFSNSYSNPNWLVGVRFDLSPDKRFEHALGCGRQARFEHDEGTELCPGCKEGRHGDHVQNWGLHVQRFGTSCPCKGGCAK
jgi:hypothetical protein